MRAKQPNYRKKDILTTERPNYRSKRISTLLKRELTLLFVNKISDVRLKSVRILEVMIDKNYSTAKVFFDTEYDSAELKIQLDRAKGFLRRQIAKTLQLRHTPNIRFIYDGTPQKARRIDVLLTKL